MTEKIHICACCAFEYEHEDSNKVDFHRLSEDWQCPGCGMDKDMFHHYACEELIVEMMGNTGPGQRFRTVIQTRV